MSDESNAPAPSPAPLDPKWQGRVLILLAAVLWSTAGFFAKAPTFDGWPGGTMAFWRAIFACLVLLPFIRRPRWNPRLIPMVLLFAAMNYTYLTAMEKSEAANAIWLQNTAPMWVFLVGVFAFGERFVPRDAWLLGCGLLGVGLILVFEFQGAQPAGVVYGLLSGVCYGGVVLSLRQLREYDAVWLIGLNHLVTAILLSPTLIWQPAWPAGEQWLYLAGFGILQMGVPYLLFARGLRSVAGHEASGIVLLEPVLVPVWVFVAWHQAANYTSPRWWTILGGSLILAGLAIRYLWPQRKR